MPEGLDIDRNTPLDGTMAAYAQHLLVHTGNDDWPSRIEDGEDGVLAKNLSTLLGRGGKFSDPYHRVLVSQSSFKGDDANLGAGIASSSAYLLPSFLRLSHFPAVGDGLERLVQSFLTKDSPSESGTSVTPSELQTSAIDEILILICGHGGRDHRCGVVGPLLRSEFARSIARSKYLEQLHDDRFASSIASKAGVRIGLISHIGGHKFAGNVILYIPPSFQDNHKSEVPHPLAGKGIWYGRVEPKHVEGILTETVIKGNVMSDLFRGGIDRQGQILRL